MSIKDELQRLTGVHGHSINDVLDSTDSMGGGSLPDVTSADIGKVMTVTDKTVVVPKDSYQSGETVISGTLPDCFVEGAKLIGVLILHISFEFRRTEEKKKYFYAF